MSVSDNILRERVKWRCRRGLLELDIFFTRFISKYLAELDQQQLEDLLDFLTCDDIEMWAMLNGRSECDVERWRQTLALLRDSAPTELALTLIESHAVLTQMEGRTV